MNRIFLSHSSTDKPFVRKIAESLGDVAIIDERDFAPGARTMDQIVEKIQDSKIFVALLSEKSLDSDWVRKELSLAINHARSSDIEILVFSIDKNVTYTDTRIPEILRNNYNIRYQKSPELILSRIRDTDRMLRLRQSPVLRKTETLFIGRANQLNKFETDFSNLDGNIPTFIIAYNYYTGMGRRHFIKHALNKISILKQTQCPIMINLRKGESIENFIIKLNTAVFSDETTKADLGELSVDDKIRLLLNLIKDYKKNNRLIFILDEGGIVLPNHKIVDWFDKLSQAPELHNRITFCIISNWEPNYRYLMKTNTGACYHIDELDRQETQNLFSQLLNIYGLQHLQSSTKKAMVSHLTGIPSQILFAVQQVKVFGPQVALARIDDIASHSDSYSSSLMEAIKKNDLAFQICLILAEGSLSLDVLYDIFGESEETKSALSFLYDYSALDYISGSLTSVKLNATISDFIERRKLRPKEEYKNKLRQVISKYLEISLDELAQDDYSKFMLVLEEYLKSGKEIPKKYYIAPLLINNIIKEYHSGNYLSVEEYCIKLLRQSNFDSQVQWELHYHLARVYARTGNEKFWNALRDSPLDFIDREFLIGFYFRNKKSPEEIREALNHFQKVLDESPTHRRARREIVNTFLLLDEYEDALEYARENYLQNTTDILHLQSYFISLIRNKEFDKEKDLTIIDDLMSKADTNSDPRAHDIYQCMRGEYEYWIKNDFEKAVICLNQAVKTNENKRYPLKSLLFIYKKKGMFEEVRSIKNQLSKL